jgi:hypothetical protein
MDPTVVAADALPAATSAAADPTPTPEPSDSLASLSETELATWKSTGDLPDRTSPVTTPPAASSAAPAVKDQPASTDAPAQPAGSDPAASTHLDAAGRIPQLLKDRKEAQDRADRAERRLAELQRPAQPSPDARPAASSAAPAGLVKPDPETFPYGTADPGYLEALADYKVDARLATERATWEEGQRQARARDESTRVIAAFEEKAAAARALHPDFDDVAMKATTDIQPGSLADLFVLENKADELGVGGAEILYFLQQPANRGEQKRILALPTMDQMIALVRLGDRLKVGAPASATSAPPPPPVLSTRATPADAVERALAMGDSDEGTGLYLREQNARDLAARKR